MINPKNPAKIRITKIRPHGLTAILTSFGITLH